MTSYHLSPGHMLEELSDPLHGVACDLYRHPGGGEEDPAAPGDGVDSGPKQTVPSRHHKPSPAVDESLAGPEGRAPELDGVGRDAGDHVDPVIGHGPQPRGAGRDDSAGGGHDVLWSCPHQAASCTTHPQYPVRQTQNIRSSCHLMCPI